jgi:5-(carboxyamino)imidazole ribonucleotide mutase
MPTVSIIAGSKSDLDFVKPIEEIFSAKNISYETNVISAHRDADKLKEYVTSSNAEYFIALAGLAAALPGCMAAHTKKPIIGVPLDGGSPSSFCGLESLLSIIQLPPPKDGKDVAVGCVAINHPEYAAKFVVKSLKIRESKDRRYDVAIRDICKHPQKDLTDKLENALQQLGLTHKEHVLEDARVAIILSDSHREASKYTGDIAGEPPMQVIVVPVIYENDVKALNRVKNRLSVPIKGKAEMAAALLEASDSQDILNQIYNLAPQGPAVAVGLRRVDNAAYLARKLIGK